MARFRGAAGLIVQFFDQWRSDADKRVAAEVFAETVKLKGLYGWLAAIAQESPVSMVEFHSACYSWVTGGGGITTL